MPAESSLAIVLRLSEFSETSYVVTFLTRDFGKIHAIAKGARRLKSPFESALDLLCQCRIVFLRKSSDALDVLTEAKLERRFRPAAGDLTSLYAGYYIAELLSELTTDYDSHPRLFDAARDALARLSEGGDWRSVITWFELTALRLLGHLPGLESCVECGAAVVAKGRIYFSNLAGGVLCDSCRAGQRQVLSLSIEALELMRQLAQSPDELAVTPTLNRRVVGELRGVLQHYLAHLLGRALKMHEYLATAQFT